MEVESRSSRSSSRASTSKLNDEPDSILDDLVPSPLPLSLTLKNDQDTASDAVDREEDGEHEGNGTENAVVSTSQHMPSKDKVDGSSEESEGEEDSSEEESDEEEEEEPTLKYNRLGGGVSEILEKDSVSAIAISSTCIVRTSLRYGCSSEAEVDAWGTGPGNS